MAKARRGAEAVVEATKVDVDPAKPSPDGVAPAAEAVGSPRRRAGAWFRVLIYGACYVVAAMLIRLLVESYFENIDEDGDDG